MVREHHPTANFDFFHNSDDRHPSSRPQLSIAKDLNDD